MDRTRFTHSMPGSLVQIDRAAHPSRRDWAFIPHPLPPSSNLFDPPLLNLVVRATDRLGNLNGIAATLDDHQLLLRPLQSQESIASSKIEGTFVTPEQLLLYEMNPREPKSTHDQAADWMEVWNYSEALKVGSEMMKAAPLGVHVIRSMHAVLMRGVRGQDKSPGNFRSRQVQIGSNARYIPPPFAEVQPLMQNLEEYIAAESSAAETLLKCFVVHYQFEAIHPFEDGNGRVGRALLSLMIQKLHGHDHPWLYLSDYFDRYQDEYFAKMFQVSTSGNWTAWLEFCLNGAIVQANDSIERCARFRALKEEFHKRVEAHSPTPRTHSLIENLFRGPIVSIAGLKKRLGVHYQTAKHDIDVLVAAGILSELPSSSEKTFFAAELMDAQYARVESF